MELNPLVFEQLGISLLLGLLVGLQREHAEATVGMRTFPLITVLGTVAAMLATTFGGWILAAGLLGVVAILVVARSGRFRQDDFTHGTTTEIAALLMYVVGGLLAVQSMAAAAVVIGGGVAVLLQYKPELHGFARKLGDEDLKGIMQFVLITCIVLPVLPNKTCGPLDVLNPVEIWLMVVLIVGMSLGGYISYKFLGRNAGILLGGVLGGAISSTATTVSYARQNRDRRISASGATIVILIASTIVFVRVLVEIAVVSPEFLRVAGPPVAILLFLTAIPSLILWYRGDHEPAVMPDQQNPTQLKSAVFFAAMYAVVRWALAAAETYVGGQALYVVAALSGLTDMDAITLSTARLAQEGETAILADGWRMILIAGMANLIFKVGIVGMVADRRLLSRVATLFLIPMLGGVLLLLLWPS
jgi:uncharacterized membrane protein (DUF4010 family)